MEVFRLIFEVMECSYYYCFVANQIQRDLELHVKISDISITE